MIIEATANELRKTGISVIGDVPWGTHFCSFYETKGDLLETLVLYFKKGIEGMRWDRRFPISSVILRRALSKSIGTMNGISATDAGTLNG